MGKKHRSERFIQSSRKGFSKNERREKAIKCFKIRKNNYKAKEIISTSRMSIALPVLMNAKGALTCSASKKGCLMSNQKKEVEKKVVEMMSATIFHPYHYSKLSFPSLSNWRHFLISTCQSERIIHCFRACLSIEMFASRLSK
ncbi:hypothetical protein WUBG_03491 [Wuchereria bancrofti]|uniref:Uncharacterized protein n=1 Tax=Wuchereria bancrofti TaxID=6293 RepID=J9F7W5_WUCBA|nr:hypothetical protein WUBG_03491 [Wuchereria bancrofti]